MRVFETMNVEFKQEYVSDIRKEVMAFANAEGGTVYVGVRKDGSVRGVDDPDAVMQQIVGSLKDALAPDIMPFVKVDATEMDGRQVVEIQVSTGTNRPYYLREKGLKPGGVYVRKGSSAQPMTEEGIREMIRETGGRSYELSRSMQQELTFHVLEAEMKKRDLAFGPSQMRTLKLIGEDGLYTNVAFLLSDQCEVSTKAALFQGKDKAVFRERKEFTGSILKQLEDIYSFIDFFNKTKATFSGLNRVDTRDYPEEAVREALLNCLFHRDYAVSGSNLVNMYDDRLEFVSVGGLVSGIELESIFLGISQTRNPQLANIFYRMKLMESYGTGIEKIERAYANAPVHPSYETAKGVFRVILPNMNEAPSAASTLQSANQRYRTFSYPQNTFVREEAQFHHDWAERIYGAGGSYAKHDSNENIRSVQPSHDGSSRYRKCAQGMELGDDSAKEHPLVYETLGSKEVQHGDACEYSGVREAPGKYEVRKWSSGSEAEDQKRCILKYAELHERITRKEVEKLIDAGTTKACRLIKELCEEQELVQEGHGKKSTYRVR